MAPRTGPLIILDLPGQFSTWKFIYIFCSIVQIRVIDHSPMIHVNAHCTDVLQTILISLLSRLLLFHVAKLYAPLLDWRSGLNATRHDTEHSGSLLLTWIPNLSVCQSLHLSWLIPFGKTNKFELNGTRNQCFVWKNTFSTTANVQGRRLAAMLSSDAAYKHKFCAPRFAN